MPDMVELSLSKILEGEALENEEAEICDFTLEEQNQALEAHGGKPINCSYVPVIGSTITYVVAAVVFNENDEVLMIQESKPSCAGKWYLPAGRIDKHETIVEAAKREVKEETGLDLECTTLLMVENAAGCWIRFVVTGNIIGGTLKTLNEADKESMQAMWVKKITTLDLRAGDIKDLIEKAREYKKARSRNETGWFADHLPALKAHKQLFLRLVIVIKKKATNRVHILLSERNAWHLPLCEIYPGNNIHQILRQFMVHLFGAEVPQHRPCGLLSVEHDGRQGSDGACLTLLVAFKAPLEEVPIIGKCVWHETGKSLGDRLLQKVSSKYSTYFLNVIR